MSVSVRILVGAAMRHHKFAKRLGYQALRAGASLNRIFDGYLFVAKQHNDSAVVTMLDPPALWLLCQYKAFGTDRGWPTRLGVRYLDRAQLAPGATTPIEAKAVARTDALSFISHGRAQFGGDPLPNFFFHGQVDWRGDAFSTNSYLSDMASTAPSPYRNVCVHSIATTFRLNTFPIDEAQPGAIARFDAALEFVWTEGGFRTLLGNPRFRFFPMAANWPSRALIVTAPRALVVDEQVYDEVVLASTYLLQGPYSTDPQLDQSDEYEHGFLVGSWQARQYFDQAYTVRWMQTRWCIALRMSQNVDPLLRPTTNPDVPGGYYRHGVTDLGIADSDTEVIALASFATRIDEGLGTQADTYGTQLYRYDRATGEHTVTTLHSASYLQSEASAAVRPMQFALNRLRYTYVDALGVEQVTEALAAVTFTAAPAVDNASIGLRLYRTNGTWVDTGLGAAGYAPFWPRLRGDYSVWGHNENLGYALAPQQMIVQDIGNGLLGVVAATKAAVAGTADIEWRLVVLSANTLEFVADRGVIATLPSNAGVTVNITVVAPETVDAPAVIAAWVGSYISALRTDHVISRDGGVTWSTLFTGVGGPIAYLGNQLRPVAISSGL